MRCHPGDVVQVVRNTLRLACVARDMGHVFTADAFGFGAHGPAWRRPGMCPQCGGERWYLDDDLQPIRGEHEVDAERVPDAVTTDRDFAHG